MCYASSTHFDTEFEVDLCFILKTTVHFVRLPCFKLQNFFPSNEKLHSILNFRTFAESYQHN